MSAALDFKDSGLITRCHCIIQNNTSSLVFAPKTILGDELLQIIVMHIIKFLKAVHKGTVIINYALHLALSSQIPQLEKKTQQNSKP
jgi:hypothetical protein